MKRVKGCSGIFIKLLLVTLISIGGVGTFAQCNQNFIYGLTNVGMIQRINIGNGNVASPLNPAYTGNAANLSNALGYNQLNGKYYYFKRNANAAPQEFISFDPASNGYSLLASAPVGTTNLINLGCLNSSGLGYYCMDAFGALYYYSVGGNTWTTICTNIKDQSGTTLSSIIGAGSLNRIYGDMAFDGVGNLWILVSGAADYGLYKISGPLPTTATSTLTATQIIAPNTVSPGGTFGGIAFSSTGNIYLSTNSPNNKLYMLSTANSLFFLTNLAVDGIGNDLTSCNYPLSVLAAEAIKLNAGIVHNNAVVLKWTVLGPANSTGYEVEYSKTGVDWTGIHFTIRNDDELSAGYTFSAGNLPGGIQYYRIKKTSETGAITYSNTETVNIVSNTVLNIWPNPATDLLQVQSDEIKNNAAKAFIYDQSGRMLSGTTLTTGVNRVPVASLKPGTYIINVKLATGETINQKFSKQ